MQSEETLLTHVVIQAKQDFVTLADDSEDWDSARRWLFSNSTRRNSFLWACRLLGLNASQVRSQATAEREAVEQVRRNRTSLSHTHEG